MEDTAERKITNVEIFYDHHEALNELLNQKKFVEFILEDSLKTIKYAADNNLDKVKLFNIPNLSLIIEIEKNQYKNILKTLLKYYESKEDYAECFEIQLLLRKYE